MTEILKSLSKTIHFSLSLAVILFLGLYFLNGGFDIDRLFWSWLFRYIHVVVGIMWIGLLWYFNFVQIPNMAKIPDDQKPAIVCVMDKKYLKDYYGILKILRDNNINSEIFLDSAKNLGKQLTYANKRKCPVAVICGENEFKENTVTLKNLLGIKGNDNQKTVKKENLVNEIKKLI